MTTEATFLPCAGGCGWHYVVNMKKAQGKRWCVLCFPAPSARADIHKALDRMLSTEGVPGVDR